MRLATVERDGGHTVAALQTGAGYAAIDGASLFDLVGANAGEVAKRAAAAESIAGQARPVAPWIRAGKIVGIGLNYADHARDLDAPLPTEPATFLRPSTAVTGPGDAIRLPPQSKRVTAEAELGLVIGRRCRNMSVPDAASVVFGYVSIIDVTAEDILKRNPRFLTRSKSFDSFFQWGPVVITCDEVADVNALEVKTVVNGEVKAQNTVAHMTFGPFELVSFLSHEMTFEPGDVISTGTPGAAPIHAGDTVSCEISGFPTLRAPVQRDA
jgi:2-keto-4-pentenoate hydratase/2-oxohepta-3-ene-1,7-dioic acid hydratase in catechol pathway